MRKKNERKKERKKKKEKYEKEKKYEYAQSELPGSLKCIRKFKASRLKDPFSFSNHVQSDN
jgi:hypothetical protein